LKLQAINRPEREKEHVVIIATTKIRTKFETFLAKGEHDDENKVGFGFADDMASLLTVLAVGSAQSAYSAIDVASPSCRAIMPWPGPTAGTRRIVIRSVAGYTGGLSAWALDGPYVIIADKIALAQSIHAHRLV
jgi:hypothetical protein